MKNLEISSDRSSKKATQMNWVYAFVIEGKANI